MPDYVELRAESWGLTASVSRRPAASVRGTAGLEPPGVMPGTASCPSCFAPAATSVASPCLQSLRTHRALSVTETGVAPALLALLRSLGRKEGRAVWTPATPCPVLRSRSLLRHEPREGCVVGAQGSSRLRASSAPQEDLVGKRVQGPSPQAPCHSQETSPPRESQVSRWKCPELCLSPQSASVPASSAESKLPRTRCHCPEAFRTLPFVTFVGVFCPAPHALAHAPFSAM